MKTFRDNYYWIKVGFEVNLYMNLATYEVAMKPALLEKF
jgi:hypothetical protein